MAFARKLFVNTHTKRLIRSNTSGGPDVSDGRILFAKYENAPLWIMLVEPNPQTPGPNSFVVPDVAGLTLKVVINDTLDDASPLVEQSSWSADSSDGFFKGYLNLNTGAMNTYVGSVDKTPYFEIQVIDSGGGLVKVYTSPCTVLAGVAQVTTTPPDVAKVYLSMAESDGKYMPRRLQPGETITLISPNGEHERIIGIRDDATLQDDIV